MERKHQHILSTARALQIQSNLRLSFWDDCVINPFWEDFIEQELIEVNKRRERVILSNLCRGGNMKFLDVCMDSFLVLVSYIPSWQKRSRIKIRTSRFIMSEKRLISSVSSCTEE